VLHVRGEQQEEMLTRSVPMACTREWLLVPKEFEARRANKRRGAPDNSFVAVRGLLDVRVSACVSICVSACMCMCAFL
jgi:hypothetical protein